jgi:hypothetical protein
MYNFSVIFIKTTIASINIQYGQIQLYGPVTLLQFEVEL